jgi:hypothetical protein
MIRITDFPLFAIDVDKTSLGYSHVSTPVAIEVRAIVLVSREHDDLVSPLGNMANHRGVKPNGPRRI